MKDMGQDEAGDGQQSEPRGSSLTFHATFGPVREDLSKALKQVRETEHEESYSEVSLQKRSGLGNKKFRPMLRWCEHMGLLARDGSRRFSEAGRYIFDRDQGLGKEPTQWFMHWHLIAKSEADCWRDFVSEFLTLHSHFTRTELESYLQAQYGDKMKPKYVNSSAGLLLKTYTDKSCLGDVGLLSDLSGFYVRGESNICIQVFSFLLFSQLGPGQSVDRDLLLNESGPFRVVVPINSQKLEAYLDELATNGLLKQQRAVKPHSVTLSSDVTVMGLLHACYE